MTTETPSVPCDVAQDFDTQEAVSEWRTVLDGVMGGRSTGTRFLEDGVMVFQGTINTNGGGFSSIRRPLDPGSPPGVLGEAEAITLRVRTDGRAYMLTFRTDQTYSRRPVSFQAAIPATTPGEWEDVSVSLIGLAPSVFGQAVPVETFNQSRVREIGVILADGIDGPFRFEMARLACE